MKSLTVRTAISQLQVGPPVASSPPDAHPSSSIEKRYALLPISCADLSIQYSNSLRVAKPTLNGITRVPTSSPPNGAPYTVSTEHDRDSQRLYQD